MAKFLNIAVQNLLDSGTDATGTASKLTVASTATFATGDYVWNTTDETYATITAIDSGTVVSISADIMDAGETYAVYSATASTLRLMAAEGFFNAIQPAPATNGIGVTTVTYSGDAQDIIAITHAPQAALTTGIALAIESGVVEIFGNGARPDIAFSVVLPVAVLTVAVN